MFRVFQNIYQAENFDEKINSKKCCKSVSPYLVKCTKCEEMICFHHCRTKKKGRSNELVCFACIWKEEETIKS